MDTRSPDEVTRLLRAWNDGEEAALDRLVPLVYAELQRIAHVALRGESTGHTLQTTALVHEAYVRLVDADSRRRDSEHLLHAAARAMRRVLVDLPEPARHGNARETLRCWRSIPSRR